MEELEFYQKSLANAAENLVNAEAACQAQLQILARLKKKQIGNKLIGMKKPAEDLFSLSHFRYKDFKGKMLKAVCISYCLEDHLSRKIQKDCYGSAFIGINIGWMLNPQDFLKGSLKITDKERDILRKMREFYEYQNDYYNSDVEDFIGDQCSELKYLKNKIHLFGSLHWEWGLKDILQDNFLRTGLRAVKTLF